VQLWRRAHPLGRVISRDLAAIDIPVIDATWISANLTPKELRLPEQNEILALSTKFTKELLEADEYAIGIPMHNWGPCSRFKLWADQIVRFGETIAVTSSGPKGTLSAKQITFFIAAGRRYDAASTDSPPNHLEPWLRTFWGYLGVRDMKFLFADDTAAVKYGKIDRATFLQRHLNAVQSLFERIGDPPDRMEDTRDERIQLTRCVS
jgi:FMN-dependent NADH-azoreductase